MVRRLNDVAATQHGAVSLDQIRRIVRTDDQLRSVVAAGWMVLAAPRVYVVAGSAPTWERSLQVGLLSLGPSAMVSHRAAAALHGFERATTDAVEFQVPRACRNRSGALCVHSTSFIGSLDVVSVKGFRVTSATRTVIDLARLRVSTLELEAAVDSAIRSFASSPEVIGRRLAALRGPGRWGCRRLDELLADAGGHTVLERRFLTLVRRAGLPRPRCQAVTEFGRGGQARVDFAFDPYRLLVEVNGRRGHASDAERAKDAHRRNELQAIGYVVLEFTWNQVTRTPAVVASAVERHLVRAGWVRA